MSSQGATSGGQTGGGRNGPASAGKRAKRFRLGQIGPAIIVAAVVLGPGSLVTTSGTGAKFGYQAAWVIVMVCVLLIAMVALATRIGLGFESTPCGEIAKRCGRPCAAAVGLVMFLMIACFQSSNNIAVMAAVESFGQTAANVADAPGAAGEAEGIPPNTAETETSTSNAQTSNAQTSNAQTSNAQTSNGNNANGGFWEYFSIAILAVVNALVIIFLYTSRELYRVVERLMKLLVLLMVLAFLANCLVARPSPSGMVKGLIPTIPEGSEVLLAGLVGTTFSIAAAFYQAYLAREKGWKEEDRRAGMIDTVVGVCTLGAVSLIVMFTSAAAFHSQSPIPELNSLQDVAAQLSPLFGEWSKTIFLVGIFAGALSSFLVNALIGGHIFSDGLGWGEKLSSRWTQHFTTTALLVGMTAALLSKLTDFNHVQLITFAQALTVVGAPALAVTLLYLGVIKRMQGRTAMPLWLLILGVAGLLLTVALAVRTALGVWSNIA